MGRGVKGFSAKKFARSALIQGEWANAGKPKKQETTACVSRDPASGRNLFPPGSGATRHFETNFFDRMNRIYRMDEHVHKRAIFILIILISPQ